MLFSSSRDSVNATDRTSFHALTVTAIHLSATIVLDCVVEPNIRTNLEPQTAVHELIHISRRLRGVNYLQTPRSLIWHLPIFIVAIEITDEIYQDWALSYLSEFKQRGTNMKKTRKLLERVISRQQREGSLQDVEPAALCCKSRQATEVTW